LRANPPQAWQESWCFLSRFAQRPAALAGAVAALTLVLFMSGEQQRTPSVAAPALVVLESHRGVAPRSAVPPGRPLVLEMDITWLRPSGDYRTELVDAQNRPVQSGHSPVQSGRARLLVPRGLAAGSYWVRLYAPGAGAELLSEYSLIVGASPQAPN
jgi:hypothetical protein